MSEQSHLWERRGEEREWWVLEMVDWKGMNGIVKR